eukprot:1188455-Prorocentrum_minimum.AAC.2
MSRNNGSGSDTTLLQPARGQELALEPKVRPACFKGDQVWHPHIVLALVSSGHKRTSRSFTRRKMPSRPLFESSLSCGVLMLARAACSSTVCILCMRNNSSTLVSACVRVPLTLILQYFKFNISLGFSGVNIPDKLYRCR